MPLVNTYPRIVQRALNALSHSTFFTGLAEGSMIGSARQVRRYFTEPEVRGRQENVWLAR